MKNLLIILSVLMSFTACTQPQSQLSTGTKPEVYYQINNIYTALYNDIDAAMPVIIFKLIVNEQKPELDRYFIRVDNISFHEVTNEIEYKHAIQTLEARDEFTKAVVNTALKNVLDSNFNIFYKRL